MTLRVTFVALLKKKKKKKKVKLPPFSIAKGPLIILQKVSKLTPVFESDGVDKIKSEKVMPHSTLISCA